MHDKASITKQRQREERAARQCSNSHIRASHHDSIEQVEAGKGCAEFIHPGSHERGVLSKHIHDWQASQDDRADGQQVAGRCFKEQQRLHQTPTVTTIPAFSRSVCRNSAVSDRSIANPPSRHALWREIYATTMALQGPVSQAAPERSLSCPADLHCWGRALTFEMKTMRTAGRPH